MIAKRAIRGGDIANAAKVIAQCPQERRTTLFGKDHVRARPVNEPLRRHRNAGREHHGYLLTIEDVAFGCRGACTCTVRVDRATHLATETVVPVLHRSHNRTSGATPNDIGKSIAMIPAVLLDLTRGLFGAAYAIALGVVVVGVRTIVEHAVARTGQCSRIGAVTVGVEGKAFIRLIAVVNGNHLTEVIVGEGHRAIDGCHIEQASQRIPLLLVARNRPAGIRVRDRGDPTR